MNNQKKAYVYALTAVLLWSTVASAFKIALRYLHPVELLFYSAVTSCFILGGIVVGSGKSAALLKMDLRQWAASVCYGMLNPCLYYLVLFSAYDLLPAQQAQSINYTWAITLSLLSVPLLKQRINRFQAIAVVIGYLGVVVISFGKGDTLSFSINPGIVLALFSTLIWAFYWIVNTKDRREPVVGLLANFLCSLPFLVVMMVSVNGGEFSWPPAAGLYAAVYVGIFEMGLAFVCWLNAMKIAKDTVGIANLIFLSPLLSLFFIRIFVGEEIMPATVLGLALILTGLAVQAKAGRAKR